MQSASNDHMINAVSKVYNTDVFVHNSVTFVTIIVVLYIDQYQFSL